MSVSVLQSFQWHTFALVCKHSIVMTHGTFYMYKETRALTWLWPDRVIRVFQAVGYKSVASFSKRCEIGGGKGLLRCRRVERGCTASGTSKLERLRTLPSRRVQVSALRKVGIIHLIESCHVSFILQAVYIGARGKNWEKIKKRKQCQRYDKLTRSILRGRNVCC